MWQGCVAGGDVNQRRGHSDEPHTHTHTVKGHIESYSKPTELVLTHDKQHLLTEITSQVSRGDEHQERTRRTDNPDN